MYLKVLLGLFLLIVATCSGAEIQRAHIPYLAQRGELKKALELYQAYHAQEKGHDFEILTQIGGILLEKGALSEQKETQLLALYGSAYASLASTLSIVEVALKSRHLQTQLAAVHLMSRFDDDRCSQLLNRAMGSDFLYTRMQAAEQLCVRKDRMAVGQIEALMYRVPREFRVYFPPFFGLIGTSDGTKILKCLLDDADELVRVEAILSVARNRREDLLPMIRSMVTHPGVREQEACAYALGELRDAHAREKLKRLSTSKNEGVKLAACRSLYLIGEKEANEPIVENAKGGGLFAIALLGEMEGSESVLIDLLKSCDPHVRLGAALSLLKRRDARAVDALIEVLVRDSRDIGFYLTLSAGRSLRGWKVLPSLEQHQKKFDVDLKGMSLSFREQVLRDCLELPQDAFLKIALALFKSRQFDLIPLLVRLVENVESPEALNLLKFQYKSSGVPLIREYCNLSLYRLKERGPFEENVHQWLKRNKGKELIRFREMDPKKMNHTYSPYELTPEEHSHLLIETCEAVANLHDEKSIDLILDLLENGNPKNQYLLAGLLLKALQ